MSAVTAAIFSSVTSMSTTTPQSRTNVPPAANSATDVNQTGTTIELIVLVILAVGFQFSVAICLCIISCRSKGNLASATDADGNVENGGPEVTSTSARSTCTPFRRMRCPWRVALFFDRLTSAPNFDWFRRRHPTSNRTDNGGIGNGTAETVRHAEPPPSYDEALTMPRTTSGHVVLFIAGNYDDDCSDRIVFRFTMTDDPTALPPTFADAVTMTSESGPREI